MAYTRENKVSRVLGKASVQVNLTTAGQVTLDGRNYGHCDDEKTIGMAAEQLGITKHALRATLKSMKGE